MKKKQSQKQAKDDALKLGDLIDGDILSQLRQKQKELAAGEVARREAEEAKKREERRLREKNKSFDELFSESNLDWKNFK